jgi:hypothetical protein
MRKIVLLFVFALLVQGCYHATVSTGLRPSTVTIEQKWALSWIYGLVPPATVETMERCPQGVARVDTQISFLNGLVGSLTFGIFTPMEIVVTCADAGQDLPMAEDSGEANELLQAGGAFLIPLE